MRVMPIRYSDDVDLAVRFYRALGLELGPACELAFEADEPLDDIAERLQQAGFAPEPIVDENFGRSMRVRDPDGVWVQINSNDRDLYT